MSRRPRIGLVLDEFPWRKQDATSLIVSELGAAFVEGDAVRNLGSGSVYEVRGRGFRPKRGGLSGVLRSELSREASLLVRGVSSESLVGQFLAAVDDDFQALRATVRIDEFLDHLVAAPEGVDVFGTVMTCPIVVAVDDPEPESAIGVLVCKKDNDHLDGELRLFGEVMNIALDQSLNLRLGSPALKSGFVFRCAILDADLEASAVPMRLP